MGPGCYSSRSHGPKDESFLTAAKVYYKDILRFLLQKYTNIEKKGFLSGYLGLGVAT